MPATDDYYVYVYIDPRNFEPFYYGKGKGSRSYAHENRDGDSRLAKRIQKINSEGEKPLIRVLASKLTEEQALLVETTLIWQADGRTLNEVQGYFAKKFRPRATLHRELPGFDCERRVYFFNVGDGPSRTWEANLKYGYVGAGRGRRYGQAIQGLRKGDIIAAYLSSHGRGFVGVGRVTDRAKPAREFRSNGKLLIDQTDVPKGAREDLRNEDKCEWMAAVNWIASVPRASAHFKRNAKLFTPALVRASLAKQPLTVKFINERFGINLFKLADG